MMVAGLFWFGSYEWFRESVRKPFVITDYMYANALEVAKMDTYAEDGVLPHIAFRTGDDGADLYRHACRSCHTMDGYRPLKPAFDGTDQEFIAAIVRGVHALKGNMPPFPGTEEESNMLASNIYSQTDHRPLGEIFGLDGVNLGKKVYDIRCSKCHVVGGYNDKTESLAGLEDQDYQDILDMAGDLGEEMPDFTGDEQERLALIEYLKTLKVGGDQ
jgi:mono/diheme cytochrome c family protein